MMYIIRSGEIYAPAENRNLGWINLGWISDNISVALQNICYDAMKKTLNKYGHDLIIESTRSDNMKLPGQLYLKDTGYGYNIGSNEDELYYACIHKEMRCAKSCADAIFKAMQDAQEDS